MKTANVDTERVRALVHRKLEGRADFQPSDKTIQDSSFPASAMLRSIRDKVMTLFGW